MDTETIKEVDKIGETNEIVKEQDKGMQWYLNTC